MSLEGRAAPALSLLPGLSLTCVERAVGPGAPLTAWRGSQGLAAGAAARASTSLAPPHLCCRRTWASLRSAHSSVFGVIRKLNCRAFRVHIPGLPQPPPDWTKFSIPPSTPVPTRDTGSPGAAVHWAAAGARPWRGRLQFNPVTSKCTSVPRLVPTSRKSSALPSLCLRSSLQGFLFQLLK